MESFDDLINEQILNELGVLGSLGQKVSRTIATAPHALGAKLGSKSAKGTLNLYDMIHNIQDDFHTYCAEQQIRMPTKEDFFDFLVHNYELKMPEENQETAIYGAAGVGAAPDAAKIAQLYDQASIALEHNQDVSQLLSSLAAYTNEKSPNGSAARKALWGLARNHAASMSKFNNVINSVGVPMAGSEVGHMITGVAKLMLKQKKGVSKDKDGTAAAGGKVDPTNLDVGQVVYDPKIVSERRNNKTLKADLAAYGISNIGKLLDAAGAISKDDAEGLAGALDKKYSLKTTINVCRILLQVYRGTVNSKQLPAFIARFKTNGNRKLASFGSTLNGLLVLSGTPKNEDDPSDPKMYYDGTKFNNTLAKAITDDEAASHMFVVLLHELATKNLL